MVALCPPRDGKKGSATTRRALLSCFPYTSLSTGCTQFSYWSDQQVCHGRKPIRRRGVPSSTGCPHGVVHRWIENGASPQVVHRWVPSEVCARGSCAIR